MPERKNRRSAAPPPSWLSVRDAAESLGVTEKTIRNWIAAGHIKADRVGPRLIRIPSSELARIGTPVGAA